MAITKCAQCGGQVSTDAATCPHCGAPRKRAGTSPWTIIGWIFLGFVVLLMYGCYQVFKPGGSMDPNRSASTPVAPRYSVKVEGQSCEGNGSGVKAEITVRNTGPTEIPFAKAFFRFDQAVEDSYFSPATIPPGALASADAYYSSPVSCGGVAIQSGDGEPVTVDP